MPVATSAILEWPNYWWIDIRRPAASRTRTEHAAALRADPERAPGRRAIASEDASPRVRDARFPGAAASVIGVALRGPPFGNQGGGGACPTRTGAGTVADYRNHGKLADYARCAKCEPRPPPPSDFGPPRQFRSSARADGLLEDARRAPRLRRTNLYNGSKTHEQGVTASTIVHAAWSRPKTGGARRGSTPASLSAMADTPGASCTCPQHGHRPHRARPR